MILFLLVYKLAALC